MPNIREIADFLEKFWFRKSGLYAVMIAAAVFFSPFLLREQGIALAVAAFFVVEILIAFAWYRSWQPPMTPHGKLGFLVSISCSDDVQRQKVHEDFVQPLRTLIKSGKAGAAFAFLEVPEHIAATINDMECAQALKAQCRAQFMIYGRVRLRTINDEKVYLLDLDGLISHSPIPDAVSSELVAEFSEFLPRKVKIPSSNDLLGFQFTSEWADIVARYIIGFAAAISGDLEYAESLFTEAKERLHGKNTKFPVYVKLKERIPTRLAEIHLAWASASYDKWAENKAEADLTETDAHLAKITPGLLMRDDSIRLINLQAIVAFSLYHNVKEAIRLLKSIKQKSQSLWHLNMAFLYGYNGELNTAIRHYRLASVLDTSFDKLAEVEDFIEWVHEKEPEKCQLSYCLGFFNWQLKGDCQKARADFLTFLAANSSVNFPVERELATKWVSEIDSSICIPSDLNDTESKVLKRDIPKKASAIVDKQG